MLYRRWTIGRAIARVEQRYTGGIDQSPDMPPDLRRHLLARLQVRLPDKQQRVRDHLLKILCCIYKRTCGGTNQWIITRVHLVGDTGLSERTIDRLLPMLYEGPAPFVRVDKLPRKRNRHVLVFRFLKEPALNHATRVVANANTNTDPSPIHEAEELLQLAA